LRRNKDRLGGMTIVESFATMPVFLIHFFSRAVLFNPRKITAKLAPNGDPLDALSTTQLFWKEDLTRAN
jgi:hypothetical protein